MEALRNVVSLRSLASQAGVPRHRIYTDVQVGGISGIVKLGPRHYVAAKDAEWYIKAVRRKEAC